jgi:drug/metabolite transporter (DMT)-like permease
MKSLHVDRSGTLFVAVWSSGYIGGSVAASAIAPLTANLWRFLLGGAVLAVIARLRHEAWPRGARNLAAAAAVGTLLFTVQFGGLYIGMAEGTPAATTALIACSSPLVVAAVAALLGWERLSPRRWSGILLGVAGVAVTLADRLGRPPSAAALAWTLFGLAGLAVGTIVQSRLRTGAGPAALAATEIAAATVVMAAWAPLEGSLAVPDTAAAIGSLAWISIIPGVLGPLLLFTLIRQRGATRASSLLFLVPAVTALAAWPVLGTPVGPTTAFGLLIAGAGLWLARATGAAPGRSPALFVDHAHRKERQAEVANSGEQAVQRRLIGHATDDHGLARPAALDAQSVEPRGPVRVELSTHADLVGRRGPVGSVIHSEPRSDKGRPATAD